MNFHALITAPNHFDVDTDEDFKQSLKLKVGDYVNIEVWKERSIVNHRKFFALLNRTIYLLPEGPEFEKLRNIEYLRKELMILCGNVDTHITMKGEMILIPKSINFQKTDDVEFNRIYFLCTQAIINTYLKHITLEQFTLYISKFI